MKYFFVGLLTILMSYTSACFAQAIHSEPLYCKGIAALKDGSIAMVNKGTKSLNVYSADMKQEKSTLNLADEPTGMTVHNDVIYVTTFGDTGKLLTIRNNEIVKSITVGHSPLSPMVSKDGTKVFILNQFLNRVAEVDIAKGAITRTVDVKREPKGVIQSGDGKYLFVTNFLPSGRADVDQVAAEVSIINLATFKVEKTIPLANGSNALRGIALTSDGKYVLISHNMGRFTVPTSQLQQGWMNTSAMSVIDAHTHQYVGAVLLDDPDRGAAGIWGIAATPQKIIITHSGTHEISVIDYPAFIAKLATYKGSFETLAYDLRFMYGIRKRLPLAGNGPRDFAVIGDKAYIPTYFSDTLNIYNIDTEKFENKALNPTRTETLAQRGERIFNDAGYCFQNWQSCNGCHPGDGRTDGMNWDLLNDGIGNPKNCKSLLYSIPTPPAMISGIRKTSYLANRAGFIHIQFHEISEEEALTIDAYTQSLRPVPSPYLVNGDLSEKAKRGRKVYEKFGCQECHSGPYYTDLKMYRIGQDVEFENGWDTPTLCEVWRTAPYLFDGRAATMREVFEVHKHGIEKPITSKELDELVEYVNSL